MAKAKAKATGPRRLICYHCRHHFEVGQQTMSTNCPKCHKRLQVEDVVIKTAHSVTKLQTCGRVLIQRKGTLIADVVDAQCGIEVLGELKADVSRSVSVRIGPKGQWSGDCHTGALKVELGARVHRGYFVVPDPEMVAINDEDEHDNNNHTNQPA